MGFYVNPRGETKESFLNREGIKGPYDLRLSWKSVPAGYLPVVLVDNGPFTAAGIAYCESELEAFTDMNDPRPRQIFFVKIEKLLPVTDKDFAEFLARQKN